MKHNENMKDLPTRDVLVEATDEIQVEKLPEKESVTQRPPTGAHRCRETGSPSLLFGVWTPLPETEEKLKKLMFLIV